MNTLVNLFHPNIEESRVNSVWRDALDKSQSITINQPYAAYPDWRIDVNKEQQLLLENDVIIFQFPFLWYSIPPLMKKWLDDVLTYGWAYGKNGKALQGKTVMLATSTGCIQESYQAGGDNKYSMTELLRPIQQTFELTQMRYQIPFIFHGAANADEVNIKYSAKQYTQIIKALKS